jgi:hypothetical protein
MKLVQAFLPSSSGVSNGKLNKEWMNPDNIGGYELGTWEIEISSFMSNVLGRSIYNPDKNFKEVPFAALVAYTFNAEETEKIRKELVNNSREFVYERQKAVGIKKANGEEIVLHKKWFNRLVWLFSNENDLPVYYFYS